MSAKATAVRRECVVVTCMIKQDSTVVTRMLTRCSGLSSAVRVGNPGRNYCSHPVSSAVVKCPCVCSHHGHHDMVVVSWPSHHRQRALPTRRKAN